MCWFVSEPPIATVKSGRLLLVQKRLNKQDMVGLLAGTEVSEQKAILMAETELTFVAVSVCYR